MMLAITMLDISVIICAYTHERWDDLLAAVDSVRHQSIPPREIIVVIDHNPDLFTLARETLRDVIVVQNRETRGLAGARNAGVAAARGAVVAFLDDDAIAAPDWLVRLSEGYADPQVLGVGGKIEPLWVSHRPGWFPEEFHWVVGCSYRGLPTQSTPVRNLIGANMSFRREFFSVVGGARNGMGRIGSNPISCEETELCIRMRQKWPEHVLLYEPQAQVHHRVPAPRTQWRYFRSRCYAEGRSKALVSQLVGARDGLTSEWTYTIRTLPSGIVRGVANSIRSGESSGLKKAASIVAGLTLTTAGYLVGSVVERFSDQGQRRPLPAREEPVS